MITKKAVQYATKFAPELNTLNGEALTAKILLLLADENNYVNNPQTLAKDVEDIRNAYAQLPADDLLGTPAPEPKAKASKPAAKKAAKPVAKKPANPRPIKLGTTAILFRELIHGKTPEQALAAALKAFPKAPTNAASAAWCKSQLACKTEYAARYIKEFGKKGK